MSEYIVKCKEHVSISGSTIQFPEYIDLNQEIVRCRDCKHYAPVKMADGTEEHRCSGVMACIKCTPETFCAWGERKRVGQ